jgi:hypothetical protein
MPSRFTFGCSVFASRHTAHATGTKTANGGYIGLDVRSVAGLEKSHVTNVFGYVD